MLCDVLARLRLQISVESFNAARKTSSIMALTKRLDSKTIWRFIFVSQMGGNLGFPERARRKTSPDMVREQFDGVSISN